MIEAPAGSAGAFDAFFRTWASFETIPLVKCARKEYNILL